MITLYQPIIVDHQGSYAEVLPTYYPSYKQAIAVALQEKASNPYVGSVSLKKHTFTARDLANKLNILL